LIRLSLLPTGHARTFQRSRLRPFCSFYGTCSLPMGRSRGFGSNACDSCAILRLAFATAPVRYTLALPQTLTRRSIMQKVRRHTFPALPRDIVLRPLVSARFQVLFTQLKAVLFIVQSPYWCAIGHRGVFSLGRWAARLHAEFHELRATLVRLSTPITPFAYGTVTLSGRPSQTVPLDAFQLKAPATPPRRAVWATSAFARRY
jgi:hypothetical protein